MLFALEESASHWSATLTIKAFICAMVAMMTVNIVFADSGFGTTDTEVSICVVLFVYDFNE